MRFLRISLVRTRKVCHIAALLTITIRMIIKMVIIFNNNNNNNNIVKFIIIIVFDNIFFCFLFANSRKNYDKEQRKNDNNEKEF